MSDVTRDELLDIARQVRDKEVDEAYGQCFPASKKLSKELASKTPASEDEVEIEEVLVGPSATIRHYVVAYPASYISDLDVYGRVLIDITLDQYSNENEDSGKVKTSLGPEEKLPEVVLYSTKEQSPYTG